jgi:surface antigen
MRTVSRDPFARTTLVRVQFRQYSTCAFCGTKQAPIYGYRIQHDDGSRETIIKGLFCSVGCMRSYHG